MSDSSKNKPQVTYLGTERAITDAHDALSAAVRAFNRLMRNTKKMADRIGVDHEHLNRETDLALDLAGGVVRDYETLAQMARKGQHSTQGYTHRYGQMNRGGATLREVTADLIRALENVSEHPFVLAWRKVSLAHARAVDSTAIALCEMALYFACHDRDGC